jgi:hypothetical protein
MSSTAFAPTPTPISRLASQSYYTLLDSDTSLDGDGGVEGGVSGDVTAAQPPINKTETATPPTPASEPIIAQQ